MRTITLALVAIFASCAFAQGKPAEKKTVEQVMKEVHDLTDKYALERIADYTGYFRDGMKDFAALTDERATAYKELEVALADGDPVLVRMAVGSIDTNDYAIQLKIDDQKHLGGELQSQIETALTVDLIDKARYLELRNMVRDSMAKTTEKLPEEYSKLLEKAKAVVPDYFEMLAHRDRPFIHD